MCPLPQHREPSHFYLEKTGNFMFSYPQIPNFWQRWILTRLETWLQFVAFKVHSLMLYIAYVEKNPMTVYAASPALREVHAPHRASRPGSRLGLAVTPLKAKEDQRGITKSDYSETYTKQNGRSPVTQPTAMQIMVPRRGKRFPEERWEA